MRKHLGRDLVLLTLPVLLLGGVALLKITGHLGVGSPLEPGPARLEISNIQDFEPSPFDVSQRYTWGKRMKVQRQGDFQLPGTWTHPSEGTSVLAHISYRLGKKWRNVPAKPMNEWYLFRVERGEVAMLVNLDKVPPQADEVHFQGTIRSDQEYSGPVPAGWTLPSHVKIIGPNLLSTIHSKPFDFVVKAPGRPMPRPVVSHETKIQLVGALWFTGYSYSNSEDFFLHLRHSENNGWATKTTYTIKKLRFLDGNGREIVLFNRSGTRQNMDYTNHFFPVQDRFNLQMPGNEAVICISVMGASPRIPWAQQKQPLRAELEVSDGTCWPTKISTPLPYEKNTDVNLKRFGAESL